MIYALPDVLPGLTLPRSWSNRNPCSMMKEAYIFLDHTQQYTASGGITYHWRSYLFSVDGTYGSGLRAGFANTDELGENFQINLAAQKSWHSLLQFSNSSKAALARVWPFDDCGGSY
jgi:hypothetical protein